MSKDSMLLLGDEGIAMGAIHSGLTGVYSYPGTPSTEITEAIQRYAAAFPDAGLISGWCINEKVAYEEALGVSMIGKRSLVVMKHVGLNVAADPFMNSAVTGVGGGLVLAVADDPSMHSSQNEQDSRYFAHFAHIPCFEPASQQECYDMTREAYRVSEQYKVPVMMRLTTRIAHSRALVKFAPTEKQKALTLPTDFNSWTLLPTNARPQYEKLLATNLKLREYAEDNPANELKINPGTKLGVITTGIGYNYFREVYNRGGIEASYLRIAVYPYPKKKVAELIRNVDKILVLEEGYPFVERFIWEEIARSGKTIEVLGKLNGCVPVTGELSTDIVADVLGVERMETANVDTKGLVSPRPPALCRGCPHIDTFNALNKALNDEKEKLVFGDIGCYTLGFYPPFNSISSCVCMGASVSMAKSAGEAGLKYSVAILGDSTFDHSGITPLLEGIKRNAPFTTIILDNSITAMTGGQETICGEDALVNLVKGMGVDEKHLRILNPLPKNLEENAKIMREELDYRGPSVIIARRACLQA